MPHLLRAILLFTMLGLFSFLMLFFAVLGNHDYYLLDMLMVWIIITIIFLLGFRSVAPKVFADRRLKTIVAVGVIFLVVNCAERIKGRYSENSWMNDHHTKYTKAFEDITSYNRSLGILSSDKVISIPDPSISITLYMMDQHGWTDYGSDFSVSCEFERRIKQGAKYLFVNDTTILLQQRLKPFINQEIGRHKNIRIFKLKLD